MLVEVSYYIHYIFYKKYFLTIASHIDSQSKLWGCEHMRVGNLIFLSQPARHQAHQGSAVADISPVTPPSLPQTEDEWAAPPPAAPLLKLTTMIYSWGASLAGLALCNIFLED